MVTESKTTDVKVASNPDKVESKPNAPLNQKAATENPSDEEVKSKTVLTEAEQIALKEIAEGKVAQKIQAAESAPQSAVGQTFVAPIDADPELAEAHARANPSVNTDEVAPTPDPGEPIQCIAKKDFFSPRGETVKAGATYYYLDQFDGAGKKLPFPYPILEPVSKAVASAKKKEYEEDRDSVSDVAKLRQKRREAFARLADETEE